MKRNNRLFLAAYLLAGPFALVSGQTAAAPSDEVVQLDAFVVSTQGDVGYSATHTSGATRINTPILDTAVSVVILNEKFLQDIAPIEPLDAMKYVSGITYSGGALTGSYTIRGYESTRNFRDGLSDYRGAMADDNFSTARIELIKGPEGVLFGSIGVGGVLNRISKMPMPGRFTEISVSGGMYDFMRTEIDHNQAFAGGAVGVRIGGVWQDSKTYTGGPYDRRGLFGYATWKPNSTTTVWARTEHRESSVDVNQSTYFTNEAQQLPTFLPRNLSPHEPWEDIEYKLNTFEVGMKHYLNAAWSARVVATSNSWRKYEHRVIKTRVNFFDFNGVYLGREMASGGLPAVDFANYQNFGSIQLGRARYYREDDNRSQVAAFDITGDFELLGMRHKLFAYLGAEALRFQVKTIVWSYPNFDFLSPRYNDNPETGSGAVGAVGTNTVYDETNFNLGIQDNIHLMDGRLIFSAGTRYDTSRANLLNQRNNTFNKDNNSGWSSKLGLVGKVTQQISLYYNYSTTFLPQGGVDHNNVPFENLEGVMDDVGVKWSLFGGKLIGSASFFASRLKNQIISGDTRPDGTQELVQLGVNKTDGWETDFRWQPIPAWSILVGYGDLTSVNERGIWVRHVPQGASYQIFTKYDFLQGSLKGFYTGLGYVYTNERSGDNSRDFILPEHGVYDLLAGYARGNWRLQLNIKNLTDETYVATGGAPRRAILGEFRNIRLTYTYRF